MRVFKNRNGFSLVEVMIAMTIMGIVMTSIFVLESNSLRSINLSSRGLDRVTAGILFLMQSEIDKEKEPQATVEKKWGRPITNMRYQQNELPAESSIRMKNMYLERVTMSGQEGRKKKEETIVMLRHRPEV